MQITLEGIKDTAAFEKAGIALPRYDVAQKQKECLDRPVWIHFGAGNIFRGFVASLCQTLLDQKLIDTGILTASCYDGAIIDDVYKKHDHLTLEVTLMPDTSVELKVIGSVLRGFKLNGTAPEDERTVEGIFEKDSLQIVSFTITEKGYALYDLNGAMLDQVKSDIENGPGKCRHAMSIVTAMLYHRYQHGKGKLALVSMDNCSHNGDKLKASVLDITRHWIDKGFVDKGFLDYVSDGKSVSFPWSMIDKITPRPDQGIAKQLGERGVEGMELIKTKRGSYISPFVNAEKPQYLIIEDSFPNGRPPLDKAGVLLTDKNGVDLCERMKVTTCLNPLHTALAVYGCVLGYPKIADEMDDELLVRLVKKLGYDEGLPVVDDPRILSPKAFLTEVIEQRLTNKCLPDTPARIATDTSMKVPVRFGETLKNYKKKGLDSSGLTALPLAIAGWVRYLMAVDDQGRPFELSDDPQLGELRNTVKDIKFGDPSSVGDHLKSFLSNQSEFGVNLYDAGLGKKIEEMVAMMIKGPGAVRETLAHYLK